MCSGWKQHPVNVVLETGRGGELVSNWQIWRSKHLCNEWPFWGQLWRELTIPPLNFLCLVTQPAWNRVITKVTTAYNAKYVGLSPGPFHQFSCFSSCSYATSSIPPVAYTVHSSLSFSDDAWPKSIFNDELNAVCPRWLFTWFPVHVNNLLRLIVSVLAYGCLNMPLKLQTNITSRIS